MVEEVMVCNVGAGCRLKGWKGLKDGFIWSFLKLI